MGCMDKIILSLDKIFCPRQICFVYGQKCFVRNKLTTRNELLIHDQNILSRTKIFCPWTKYFCLGKKIFFQGQNYFVHADGWGISKSFLKNQNLKILDREQTLLQSLSEICAILIVTLRTARALLTVINEEKNRGKSVKKF